MNTRTKCCGWTISSPATAKRRPPLWPRHANGLPPSLISNKPRNCTNGWRRSPPPAPAATASSRLMTDSMEWPWLAAWRTVSAACGPCCGVIGRSRFIFHFSTLEPGARSLDRELREILSHSLDSAPFESGKRVEHLAVFSRWYYSSWRDGDWFPFQTLEDLNYRRLVREISKLTRS